jgi:uncharacterized protein (TIGR03437 family)
MRKQILAAALCAAAAWAQPVLRTTNPVVNGASYVNAIAPGSVFVVFGTNLAGDAVVQNQSLPVKTSLGGVSIRFTPASGGNSIDALMIYTTKNQVAGLLPSSAAPGSYNVTLTYNGQTTAAPGKATVVATNYGIVSADSSGAGQVQSQDFRSATAWDLNRFATGTLGSFTLAPANPGEVIILWGTGFGADSQSDLNGGSSGDQTATLGVKVTVGTKQITPAYAGRSSGLPGTDQVNFTLPADVDTGCAVPVQVSVNGTLSNQLTMAIVPAGQDVCQHSFLSGDALRRLSGGGSIVMADFSLAKLTAAISAAGQSMTSSTETAGGEFTRYGLGNLPSDTSSSSIHVGACTVVHTTVTPGTPAVTGPPDTYLDAGDPIRLNGPNASNVSLTRDPSFAYSKMLAQTMNVPGLPSGVPGLPGGNPVIAAGTYTLTGPGGKDIGPFTATVTVPTPLVWTNMDTITSVDRSQGLTVNWSGGGSANVYIMGNSSNMAGGASSYDLGIFVCYAAASAGTFTVPASVLTQLPVSTSTAGGPNGILTVGMPVPSGGVTFTAPLVAGGSIDHGEFGFAISSMKNVGYK